MEVYLDAVFHPNITKYKEIFMQEGWHYELESEDAPLTINGVVYNEMKGAYSSPDEVLETAIMEALFPDNTYSKNSGGNPEKIPELTYENYLAFYHKYYHPCNSYIYLYGDMDIEERLTWLDEEYLSHYDANEVEVHSQIQLQKPFDAVVSERRTYPITEDEPRDFKFTGDHAVYVISRNAANDVMEYYNQQHGMQCAWFRFPPVYGVGPHGTIYVNGTAKKSGIATFIDNAKEGKEIEIWGDPHIKRDIIYVKDVAEAYVAALKSDLAYGLYNMTGHIQVDLDEQVKAVIEVFWRREEKPDRL